MSKVLFGKVAFGSCRLGGSAVTLVWGIQRG